MFKKLGLLVLVSMFVVATPVFADSHEGGEGFGEELGRGLTNVISAPVELFRGLAAGHQKEGTPGVKHLHGLVQGGMKMFQRAGSGAWDILVSMIPGDQPQLEIDPETLQ